MTAEPAQPPQPAHGSRPAQPTLASQSAGPAQAARAVEPPQPAQADHPVETEAKLRGSARAFAEIDRLQGLDGWRVLERRDVRLRDTYWDTPDGRLARAGCTLRVRESTAAPWVSPAPLAQAETRTGGAVAEAELTLKGPVPAPKDDASVARGQRSGAGSGAGVGAGHRARSGPTGAAPSAVWQRTELTVPVPTGSGPAEWRDVRAAAPVLEALERLGIRFEAHAPRRPHAAPVPPAPDAQPAPRPTDAPPAEPAAETQHAARRPADAFGGLRPDIVLRNPRREIVLEAPGGETRVVLSLDEVAVEGAPYRRRYVEVELARGDPAPLDDLVASLSHRFGLRPSRQGKVQAARRWLAQRRPA